jgi:hypothetical protein
VVVRYEKKRPGELLHLDMKKLGRIQGVGHRIHGDRQRRARGIGWEFLHVCVDDATRVAYAEVLPDERESSATGFVQRAIAWFRERDVHVERIDPPAAVLCPRRGRGARLHGRRNWRHPGARHPRQPTASASQAAQPPNTRMWRART